jgi:hypothetical protein
MAANRDNSAKWKLRLVVAVIAGVGVIGSIWHDGLPWQWARELARDFSVALFVAGILAASVDTFFKTEFAKDVFNAAFSYFLPEQLKQEIRRIIEYKFLCVKHEMTLKLIPSDGDLFQLEISIERTVRNISRYNQDVRNSFALDEWGHRQKSEIVLCTMKFGGKTYTETQPRSDLKEVDAIGVETKEVVSLKHGEEVVLVSKGHEIKVGNSEHLISFRVPTVNPVVDVQMPPGFSHNFGFGAPGEVTKSSIAERYELAGTQFPGQYMRLRWWPSAEGAAMDYGLRQRTVRDTAS